MISGNNWRGVFIDDASDGPVASSGGTRILGNYIGTDASGTAALPYSGGAIPAYQQIGIAIWGGPDNVIGTASSGNTISGNSWHGVYIWGAEATGSKIQGNTFGLDVGGSNPLPNGYESVARSAIHISSAPSNLIGGIGGGEGNLIESNSSHGIVIVGATAIDNTIVGNSIFGNGGLGIDLELDGVTPNDPDDDDTDAANDLLNFPVIVSGTETGGIVTLTGAFDVPAGWYRFEFFKNTIADPSGYGEGQTFVGSASITHTGAGDEPWGAAFPGSVGDIITATLTECTDSGCSDFGSTSEFSASYVVTPPNNPPVAVDDTETTLEDIPVVVDVADNDSDTDGNLDITTAAATTLPVNGSTVNNGDGTITYTPASDWSGTDSFDYEICDTLAACSTATVTVTVTPVNDPPVLAPVGDKSVDELVELAFTATASDVDVPVQALTFSLSGEPVGASIDSVSGVFSWTPTEVQGPGVYTFDVEVTDGIATDFETITVTVGEVNVPPVLAPVGPQAVGELVELAFTATASDVDVPAQTLVFSLSGEPVGASIDSVSGVFSWTPTEAQGPGVYTFDVEVTDGIATDFETITVTVGEVNVPPVLAPVGDRSVDELVELAFTATASDVDVPAQTLVFSLSGEPVGASIDSVSGVFSWTPIEVQGPGVYTFDVVVTDGVDTDSRRSR